MAHHISTKQNSSISSSPEASDPGRNQAIDYLVVAYSKLFLLSWAPKSLLTVTAVIKLKDACPFEEKL